MRFMVIVKADKRTEAGTLPSVKDLEVMGRFNEELVKAGALVDGAGLQPTSKGARIANRGGKLQVTDGPFAETKEIIAGYWILDVASKAEAIEWCKRVPFDCLPHDGRDAELELRQVYDVADFPNAPQSVVEREERFKAKK